MAINLKPFYLGRLFGIPIRAHYSWIPVIPFYAWAIASGLLPREAPELATVEYWALGLVTSLLLFVSVIAHELAHALMARTVGVGTRDITLYMFGGLATLEGQPADPSAEFKIAVVGPAASFMLGTLFFAVNQLLLFGTPYRGSGQVLRHLGLINWFLAGYNLLPGMPLDGGRVLRALLWKQNKNFRAATQQALKFGLIIAITLIATGIYFFLWQEWITGMWSMTIGLMMALMLGSSAGATSRNLRVKRGTIEEVMNRDVVLVPPTMTVSDFIEKVLKNNHHTSFPISLERQLHGLLLLEELKAVPPDRWPKLQMRDVMRPVDSNMFLSQSTPLAKAHAALETNSLGRAVVLDSNGLIVGYVSLGDLKKADAAKG